MHFAGLSCNSSPGQDLADTSRSQTLGIHGVSGRVAHVVDEISLSLDTSIPQFSERSEKCLSLSIAIGKVRRPCHDKKIHVVVQDFSKWLTAPGQQP